MTVPEDLAPNWDRPEAYWWRQGVRRAAHELAEKQRQHLRDDGYEPDCICEECSACLASEYINLIDPEARA
ncbi:hypothetical protein ACGF5F_29675 [Streptomyces sp. NPDC047821]|uniref:hypothetical protein n=1 Tax=Streptomyces sp. NPDC047821 TaxID=3365488 RepID=UPI00372144C4